MRKDTHNYFDSGNPKSPRVSEVNIYLLYHLHEEFPEIKGCFTESLNIPPIEGSNCDEKLYKFLKRFRLTMTIDKEYNFINYVDSNYNLATELQLDLILTSNV